MAEADRRGLWGGKWDAHNLAEWISWLTGMSPKSSKDRALVAAKLEELPATHAALAEGVISFDQARLIASAEAPEHEAKLAGLGSRQPRANSSELFGPIARSRPWERSATPTGRTSAGTSTTTSSRIASSSVGGLRTRTVPWWPRRSIEPRTSSLDPHRERFRFRPNRSPPGTRRGSSGPTRSETAESWLDDHKVSGRTNSYEVVVHVDADALSEDAPGGRCEIDGAGAIAPETARRLTCDSGGTGRVRRRTVLDR